MSANPEIRVGETPDEAVSLAISEWREALEGGTPETPRRVLLAGGTTPERLYGALARPGAVPAATWRSIECYQGDERCVPPDHADSNYGMIRRALLAPLGDDAPVTHRMRGEDPDPDRAARDYEALIRERLHAPSPSVPSFDLALQGIGADGHTASLFPGTVAAETERLVVPAVRAEDGSRRITVTYRVLRRARVLLFFVLGAAKSAAVASSIRRNPPDPTPAALSVPPDGRTVWVLDRAAASLILA